MTQDTSPVQAGQGGTAPAFGVAPGQIQNVTPAGPHTVPAPTGFTPIPQTYGLPVSPVPLGGTSVNPAQMIPTAPTQNLDGSLTQAHRVAQLQAELQSLTGINYGVPQGAPWSPQTGLQGVQGAPVTQSPSQGSGTPPDASQGLQKGLPAKVGGFNTSDATPEMQDALKAIRSAIPGVNIERAIGNALKTGDPSLVDLEYLTEKSPQNAALVAQMARSLVQQVNQAAESLTREVYSSVGGEAQWNQMVSAFNNTASQSIRAAVATMLDSSSPDQVRAGAEIIKTFVQQTGMFPQTSSQHPLYPASPAISELDEAGFQRGLNDLRALYPENSPQFNQGKQDLMNRRLAALQRQYGGGVPGLTR